MKFLLLLFAISAVCAEPPYGLSAADPRVELLGKDLEMPQVKGNHVQTLNLHGSMLLELDRVSTQFIETAKASKLAVLDIGSAYGVATLPVLKDSTCDVIAADL